MTNPLSRRRAEPMDFAPVHRTPQDHADYLNATMTRTDIEWVVGENGLFLRDKPSWSARRTVELDRKAEQDREDWKRAQRQAGEIS